MCSAMLFCAQNGCLKRLQRCVGFVLGSESCDVVSRLGNPLPYRRQFVCGFFVDFGAEYVWGRRWAVFLCPRLQYLVKTQFQNFEFLTNIGVKFYF